MSSFLIKTPKTGSSDAKPGLRSHLLNRYSSVIQRADVLPEDEITGRPPRKVESLPHAQHSSCRAQTCFIQHTPPQGSPRGLKVSGSYVTITEVNWMFMGSSKEIFFCRSWSCCSCWLPPACITSSKWSIPGCRLSRTITERRSGSLRREGRTQISGSWRDPSFSVRLRSFSSISRCLMLNVKHRFNLFDLDI